MKYRLCRERNEDGARCGLDYDHSGAHVENPHALTSLAWSECPGLPDLEWATYNLPEVEPAGPDSEVLDGTR